IAQARRTQRRRADAIALVDKSGHAPAKAHLTTALEQEKYALEHTFDAWSTTEHPAAPANAFQQAAKELTLFRAELYLDEAIGAALRSMTQRQSDGWRLYAYSDSAGARFLHFDAGDFKLNPARQQLVTDDGQAIPFQEDFSQLRQYVAVVPAKSGLQSLR